jgi:hypothetical protein
MRKALFFLLAYSLQANAQYPSMSDYIIGGISSTTFKYENCFLNSSCYDNQKKIKTEVPPWIIGGGWRTYFFDDGRKSYIWSSPSSLIDNSTIDLKNDAVGPFNVTYPYILDGAYSSNNPAYNWKRNYHAVFTAQYINHPSAGTVSLAYCHGENKNEVFDDCASGAHYQNTIQPNMLINCSDHLTWSGGSPYQDGWKAYNGILSAAWVPNNQQTNWGQQFFSNELGPIAWPSMGYITTNGERKSNGLIHPSSIIVDGFIYIFYVETGSWTPSEEGRLGGVKLLRVNINDALDASQYQTYYKDQNGIQTWNPSLPAGFTKDNMLSYASVQGPKSTDILNDNNTTGQVVRFSVARVKNTNYFIGLEQYSDWTSPTYYLAVRFSADLLDWTPRQVIYSAVNWDNSKLNYPVFLDKTGWSNNEVDGDDFYIIGTENYPKDYINKMHVYKYVPPPPPPPPSGDCPPDVYCIPTEVKNKKARRPNEGFEFKVMPNPATRNISIRFNMGSSARIVVRLYDSQGKLIKNLSEEIISDGYLKTYDLSNYASGFYYLEILTKDAHFFKKIIKQ